MRIYAGEDCPAEAQLLVTLFAGRPDLEFRLFTNGLSLLEAIHRDRPELVLVDLTLPGVDGIILVRLIKFDRALAEIPILCLSALRRDTVLERTLRAGADACFFKPWNSEELLNWVDSRLILRDHRPGSTQHCHVFPEGS